MGTPRAFSARVLGLRALLEESHSAGRRQTWRTTDRHHHRSLPRPPSGFLNLLLAVAAAIAWAIGDGKCALMIGAVSVFNAILGFVQEHRAERALLALERTAAFRARVRRGDRTYEIGADELVPGDIVLLEAGDRIPADGRLLFSSSLEVDESALMGESAPVRKTADAVLPLTSALAERTNVMFMNSVVTRGRGELVVSATGSLTEMGRIARLLAATKRAPTPLQIPSWHRS